MSCSTRSTASCRNSLQIASAMLEGVVLLGRAVQQPRGVLHPVRASFLPVLPARGQAPLQEHRTHVLERNRRLAVDLARARLVGEEREEQAELSGGPHEIVLAGEPGELLVDFPMAC